MIFWIIFIYILGILFNLLFLVGHTEITAFNKTIRVSSDYISFLSWILVLLVLIIKKK